MGSIQELRKLITISSNTFSIYKQVELMKGFKAMIQHPHLHLSVRYIKPQIPKPSKAALLV
jgi:hypothetical protein